MPKGVICGGAVDGSNHVGAMVTCHAMTASPGWAARAGPAPSRMRAAKTRTIRARWKSMRPPSAHVFVVVLEGHVDERRPAVDFLAHGPGQRPHAQHHAAILVVELLAERLGHPGSFLDVELPRDRVDVLVVRSVGQQVEGALGIDGALP